MIIAEEIEDCHTFTFHWETINSTLHTRRIVTRMDIRMDSGQVIRLLFNFYGYSYVHVFIINQKGERPFYIK